MACSQQQQHFAAASGTAKLLTASALMAMNIVTMRFMTLSFVETTSGGNRRVRAVQIRRTTLRSGGTYRCPTGGYGTEWNDTAGTAPCAVCLAAGCGVRACQSCRAGVAGGTGAISQQAAISGQQPPQGVAVPPAIGSPARTIATTVPIRNVRLLPIRARTADDVPRNSEILTGKPRPAAELSAAPARKSPSPGKSPRYLIIRKESSGSATADTRPQTGWRG